MPKLPRLTAVEAERILLQAGFQLIRSTGSHRIYMKGDKRFVLPFHAGKTLHSKTVKQLLELNWRKERKFTLAYISLNLQYETVLASF